ncbi:MAG: response regulator [Alphaproteobacteria bacterium]|nr:response regulator [Alphaproteobacteria bacterium]
MNNDRPSLEKREQDTRFFKENEKEVGMGNNLPLRKKLTIDEYVGQKLRDFRERANLTLLECAEKIGVSHQQIHKYEIGQTKISTSILYKLCKIFSVTPNCFFEGYIAEQEEVSSAQDSDIPYYQSLDKINVLLVEDNSEDQFLIRRALEEYDLKINFYCIHDGEEFLDIIKRRVSITRIPIPDIIFLDLNMPKINGAEILKSIKQSKDLKYIPVLVLTGSISRKDVIDSYKNYASGYIRKSFEYETLKKNIHIAINYWTEAVVLPHHAWA